MRRLAPRPLASVLAGLTPEAEPATLLARVQTAWPGVVGPENALRTAPVSEREGVVTVACESGVWAQEMELQGQEILGRLRAELAAAPAAAPERLRFVIGSVPNGYEPAAGGQT